MNSELSFNFHLIKIFLFDHGIFVKYLCETELIQYGNESKGSFNLVFIKSKCDVEWGRIIFYNWRPPSLSELTPY